MTAAPATQPLGETLTPRQKWLLLGSLMVSLFIGALDQTVVSTATPRILADLGGFTLLSWLFTSYMLTSTVVIPLVGKLGDIYGRKLFLIGGVFLFMVASAACGAAPNMPVLIWMRALQGLGGGMIFASVFATMGDLFAPAERGKYIGLFTGVFSLASVVGPTFGGFLTDTLSWRWVFYINIPVGLIAIPAIWFNLPAKARSGSPKLDFLGAALLSAASVMALLALVWAGEKYAWDSPQIVGLLAGSVVLVGLFVLQELRHPEPTLPLHLFRNRVFLLSNLVVFTFGFGVFGAFQFLGIYVQTALGASATESGVITTPQSLGVLVTSVVGGQVIARTGRYKWQTFFGTVLIASALGLLTQVSLDTKLWQVSATMVVLGLGFGLVLPTMSLVVQNAVGYQYIGVASSASQFFRQIGSVLGIAVFGAILANTYHAEFSARLTAEDKATLGPQLVQQLDDPTIRLNEAVYARIEQSILQMPDGENLLARTHDAQGEGVVIAVRHIYWGAVAAAILCAVLAFMMPELPLRRTVAGGPPGEPGREGQAGAPPLPVAGALGE
ncbi:MDR family MFS transporter [Tepidiforma sp.]|uniref:MDR family MFS transporter n=1 Tax=Tepidiforma sp. TaxID=2682230 RepID=UPI002603B328|nr:MDR family MFS transporter [Tepidiforma sp.]MCX7617583.1 MFS transporter [Tepidiforma sp.]